MRRWPLKFKVGVFAALLTVITMLIGAVALFSVIYLRQLHEIDNQLTQDAEEWVRDLRNFRGAPVNPRHPLGVKFVPVNLREHHLMLQGPEGQVLYQSPGLKGRSLDGPPGFRTMTIDGVRCRAGTFRDHDFTIHIAESLAGIEAFHKELAFGLLMTMPLVAVMVFGGGLWLGNRAVAPVAALSEAAENISVENLTERLPEPPAADEIARLTVVLNDAFDRMRASYIAAARFSADASHQLKTPVAVLRAGLEAVRDTKTTDPSAKEEINHLLDQVRRLSGLIHDLLLLARSDSQRLRLDNQPLNLAELAEAGLDDLQTLADESLDIQADITNPLIVSADKAHAAIVIQNLIENAAKYTPHGGSVRLSAATHGEWVRFSVANTGPALPESDREGIFERFRRGTMTCEQQSGHGLGLNIARELARAHGGDLVLERSDGEWTEFVFTLPRHGDEGISR
jgi:signal transduction histidine kinase